MPEIPGLIAVRPNMPVDNDPGTLTKSQVKKIFHGMKEYIKYDDLPNEDKAHLLNIQEECQNFVRYGLNPSLIGIEDFNVGFATVGMDINVPFLVAPNGVQMVAVHKDTKESIVIALSLPARPGGHRDKLLWSSAGALIGAGPKVSNPEE